LIKCIINLDFPGDLTISMFYLLLETNEKVLKIGETWVYNSERLGITLES